MGDDDLRNRYRRDYTSQPIGQSPRPAPSPATAQSDRPSAPAQARQPAAGQVSLEPAKKIKPSRRPKRTVLALVLILIIISGGMATYWYRFRPASSPIPENILSSANFPLLYPASLPAGYHINPASFSSANGAIIFEAANQAGGKIVFSEQKRPATFDFPSFYKQGLGGASPFNTFVGEAAIGKTNNQTVGSIATNHSWMLVTSPGALSDVQLKLILSNIKSASN